jgi:dTDP-4-dehydrorhamnose reductase
VVGTAEAAEELSGAHVRILITGAGGQVGHELVDAFADHDVTALDHDALDVADRAAVLAAVTNLQPDAIVHSAAWTAVDACEADPDRAFAVNALGTRYVAEAARRVRAHLCTFSTDYVFDGTKPEPYTEWDVPNPQSVYGRSKHAGELELAGDSDATVLRISWVCGEHGNNMVKTILRLAAEHDTLRFVDDQRGHPTFADDLAGMVRRLVVERRAGLFHVTNQGAVSWFEFARAVLESSGQDPARVLPIGSADLDPPRPAPRPANSVLDNAALRLSGIPLLPHYRESLDRLVGTLTG